MSELNKADELVGETAVLAPQVSVGEQLGLAREARGLAVAEVAQMLKLGERQVRALESGDWAGLPGHTFVRGFVRNYARLLQIDSAPLMIQLDATLERPLTLLAEQESRPAEMPRTGGYGSHRDRTVVLIGGGLVVLAALAYFLLPGDLSALRESTQSLLDSFGRKEEVLAPAAAPDAAAQAGTSTEPVFPPGTTPQQIMNPQAVVPLEQPAPVPSASEKPEQTSLTPAQPPVAAVDSPVVAKTPQMRFIFDKESWLEVRDRDNKLIFSQRVMAGSEQTLSGQGPLSLTIGYAPGVRLFWHGQAVDLAPHTRGDVARLVLE